MSFNTIHENKFLMEISEFTVIELECDFQQCGILTSVDSYEPVQPPFKLRTSKCCSVSSLTVSGMQRLWSDCACVQADLSLCWSHIPHCWKYQVAAQIYVKRSGLVSRALDWGSKVC